MLFADAHEVVTPFMSTDSLLLAAPLLGAFVNALSQIALGRLLAGGHLFSIIVAAFVIGCVLTVSITLWALSGDQLATLESGALFLCVTIIYLASSFILFAIVNLGETSLRIRMLDKLMDKPLGLTKDDLIADYDDSALINVRLQRLKDKGQVTFVNGVFYAKPSLLFLAASVVRLLKTIIYGRR
jgi:hypothetical protein